jgi:uncharacterized RDD family membrane protein YckC
MASADYQVLTPERVTLQYDIAGLGSRCAAALVDTAIQFGVLVVVGLGVLGMLALNLQTAATIIGVLAVALVTLGYFLLFEIIWNGQTPGKRLVGVRVIRESGYPVQPADVVVRNLVRIVDGLPGFYAAGVVTMLLNRRSKRLGDFAAGTIVVREGSRAPLELLPAPVTAAPSAYAGVALQAADATLVRDFLVRRASLDPVARTALAARLASSLARRYGLQPAAGTDAEAFLEALGT